MLRLKLIHVSKRGHWRQSGNTSLCRATTKEKRWLDFNLIKYTFLRQTVEYFSLVFVRKKTVIYRGPIVYRNCVIEILHYGDVIMDAIASQITSPTIVYSTVHSDADQRKHQSSASLAFVRRIHRSPVNSPHKWPVTRKMFPFHDVIMDFTAIHELG